MGELLFEVTHEADGGYCAECLTENIKDLAAESLALLVELAQEPFEDLALSGVLRDEIPQAAGVLLTYPVDAPEPLLEGSRRLTEQFVE